MDAWAIQHIGVGQRFEKARLKFVFAPGQAGQAAFACIPIAGRCIEEHLLQTVVAQALLQVMGIEGVREQIFNSLKAVFGGCSKAV